MVAVAPAHHGSVDGFVVFGTDVEEGRTLGSAEPFVAVPRVEIGAEGVEIQRNVAGSVGAVDEGENARFSCTAAEFRQGKNQGGGGRDVAQLEHPRSGSDLSPDALDELLRLKGQGDRHGEIAGAGTAADVMPCVVAGAVLVIGGENLVPRHQRERPGHGVDAAGGVRDVDQIFGPGSDVAGEHLSRLSQQLGGAASQKLHGVFLHRSLPFLEDGENLLRTGAEGAVVQKDQ